MPFCRCSKILGQAGKQEILQQIFPKFQISNRLPNRYFPENCHWVPLNIVLHHYYFTNSSTEKAAFTCYHKQYTRKCLSFSFTLSYQDEKNYLDSRAMLRHLYPFQIIHLTIQSKFTNNSLISFSYYFHHGDVT